MVYFLATTASFVVSFPAIMAVKVKVVQRRTQTVPIRKVTVKELRARLKPYEKKYGLTSAEFYERFRRGEIEDTKETVDWYIDYQFYMLAKGEPLE